MSYKVSIDFVVGSVCINDKKWTVSDFKKYRPISQIEFEIQKVVLQFHHEDELDDDTHELERCIASDIFKGDFHAKALLHH